MALSLPDVWVWDSWYVDDGAAIHAFYLKASRALLDPEARHLRASVGHSISTDLVNWSEVADALVPGEPGHFDDQAIWTGSIVTDSSGLHHMFYTGVDRRARSDVQAIGHATSTDLLRWHRVGSEPVVRADPHWYCTHASGARENWRDPFVFAEGDRWRMLITADSVTASQGGHGAVATAISDDLYTWQVQAPLAADIGLRQMEVLQTVCVDGQWVGVFCLAAADVRAAGLVPKTGTWTVPAQGPAGPFDFSRAEAIDVAGNYAGRIVRDRSNQACLMAFVDLEADGTFGGRLGNPVPLAMTARGTVQPAIANPTDAFRR